jgi:hypothetical protein
MCSKETRWVLTAEDWHLPRHILDVISLLPPNGRRARSICPCPIASRVASHHDQWFGEPWFFHNGFSETVVRATLQPFPILVG